MTIVINFGDSQVVVESLPLDDDRNAEIYSNLHEKALIMKARLEAVFGPIEDNRREIEDRYNECVRLRAEREKFNATKPMKLWWFSDMLGSIFTSS
jgi:hypothetical protein